MPNKDRTLDQMIHQFYELEAKKGHKKWAVTELARKAGVSRSLVYRYLGHSKDEIIKNALKHSTDFFYGIDPTQGQSTAENLAQQIASARATMIASPSAVVFYQKWRATDGWICAELIKVEKKFQTKMRRLFPTLSELEIVQLHAFLHGLVTAPFISPEKAADALRILLNLLPR